MRICIRTVGRVVNGDDDARSKHNLLPGLANVEHVDAVGARLPQIRLHVHLEVLAAEGGVGGEEHLDVLLGGVEDGGEIRGSHLGEFGGEGGGKAGIEEAAMRVCDVELLVEG